MVINIINIVFTIPLNIFESWEIKNYLFLLLLVFFFILLWTNSMGRWSIRRSVVLIETTPRRGCYDIFYTVYSILDRRPRPNPGQRLGLHAALWTDVAVSGTDNASPRQGCVFLLTSRASWRPLLGGVPPPPPPKKKYIFATPPPKYYPAKFHFLILCR